MYAGAPRVVASLWKVSDRATADLMGYFYAGMLKQGMRPPAALRAAQVAMLKNKRRQAPYYWAPFVLQGEWSYPQITQTTQISNRIVHSASQDNSLGPCSGCLSASSASSADSVRRQVSDIPLARRR
jgi:hypothetical protein